MKPLLGSWRNEAARDTAVLLPSEIVTNAIRHAHGETILIIVTTMDHHLRAEVHDESASLPIPRPSDETGGLGLKLIDQLSDQWGVHQHQGDGKTVWFEMDDSDPDLSDPRSSRGGPGQWLRVLRRMSHTTMPTARTPAPASVEDGGRLAASARQPTTPMTGTSLLPRSRSRVRAEALAMA